MSNPRQFMEQFKCSGLRKPVVDEEGEPVWQLYRIWDKSHVETKGSELCYKVEYWDEPGKIYASLAWEIEANYPEQAQEWRRRHVKKREAKCRDRPNIWKPSSNTSDPTPPEPVSKRGFTETPRKEQ